MEINGDLEVVWITVAASALLDRSDLGVQTLSDSVGDEMLEVGQHIRQVASDQLGGGDYRRQPAKGRTRHKTMTLANDEFMRWFLLHVLPGGFHRIRHYGLIANARRKENLARVRELLAPENPGVNDQPVDDTRSAVAIAPTFVCRCCGASMIIIETFFRGQSIRA